jgi:hypothetical protein
VLCLGTRGQKIYGFHRSLRVPLPSEASLGRMALGMGLRCSPWALCPATALGHPSCGSHRSRLAYSVAPETTSHTMLWFKPTQACMPHATTLEGTSGSLDLKCGTNHTGLQDPRAVGGGFHPQRTSLTASRQNPPQRAASGKMLSAATGVGLLSTPQNCSAASGQQSPPRKAAGTSEQPIRTEAWAASRKATGKGLPEASVTQSPTLSCTRCQTWRSKILAFADEFQTYPVLVTPL